MTKQNLFYQIVANRYLVDQGKIGATRIMVTLNIDNAHQPQLLEELLKNGMDIARINCAYYKSSEWKMIIDAVRNAEKRLIQRVRHWKKM
jgi:pyruvate kinase